MSNFIDIANIEIEEIPINELKSLKIQMKSLSDYRQKHKCNYKTWDIVTVIFLAVLANQKV